ncbi:hypothetical protein [Pseudomonas sp. GV071]|uniref:hypothetical protein n=1 Tax=Pseudomonas sp. GV071 TaxID=2135754 RepID=UPI000D39FC26|nr:hypothetical protein [Pseudomonas sp. GV071]PTQ70402.1 hypothetical protein C8K61_106124 [Pseudomonas sp. GV071]
MVNIEFSQKADARYNKHFASEMDDISLILKGHLLLEEMLRDFCSAIVPQPKHLSDCRFTFAQILDLSHALYPADIKLGRYSELWAITGKINRLRNLMAHALEPDSQKLEGLQESVISTIKVLSKYEHVNLAGCLSFILATFSAILQIGVTHNAGEDFRDIPRKS